MNIAVSALEAPTKGSLEEWLNTPRLAQCGEFFTPAKPMWWPDRSANMSVNWQAAIACVPSAWQGWLQAALAYRMGESAQGTIIGATAILSRAAQVGLNPLNEDHLIDLRERLSMSAFSALAGFMKFWQQCESLEKRPSQVLIDAYDAMPRKKRPKHDVVLSLDPEQGPFIQPEQDALHQWAHEQFCHGNLDEDFYNIVQAYQSIVLARLEQEYPGQANWNKAIKHLPLFRRKLGQRGGRYKLFPVLANLPDQNILEQAPQAKFHASGNAISSWMREMETMPGFPISSRTHQPLKISRGHRFRHTLGTDLSNAGLDEWSIASALMHANTQTVRKYRAVSPELMKLIDEKMSDHLALVVNAFTGTIVTDRASAKNGDQVDRQIEDLAVCGADTVCHLDAPFTCYGCSKFQPLFDADHSAALERLERRRSQTIETDKTTGVLWDRAILACRKVILDCSALRESGKADGNDS